MNTNKSFSKLMALVLSVALVFTMMPNAVSAEAAGCNHIHDEACGYMEGVDCSHTQHDENCGCAETTSCSHRHNEDCGWNEETGDGCSYIQHDDDCGCAEVTACIHTKHDDECGYIETVICGHVCDENCGELIDLGKTPGKSDDTIIIAAFEPLDDEVAWRSYTVNTITETEFDLPVTLNGTDMDDNIVTIEGVTWESCPEFDPAASMGYVFSAVMPEGYELADGVSVPDIRVFILPEGGLMPQVMSDDQQVNIDGLTATSTIQAPIQTAIDDAAVNGGGIVTIKGTSAINVASSIRLNIPANVTVRWEAILSNNAGTAYMLILEGTGSFVMAAGSLTNEGSSFAIFVSSSENVSVTVSGGMISSVGSSIRTENAASAVTVTGGEIKSTGSGTYAINATGDVTLSGNAQISSTSGNGVSGATVTISDTVQVTAGQFAVTGNAVIMTGGTVTATDGNAILVRGYGHAVISGGTVTTNAGSAVDLANGTVYVLGGIISQNSSIVPSTGTNYAYYLGDRSGLFGSSYYWGGRYRLDALTYKGPNNTDYTYSSSAYVSGVTASFTNASLMDLTEATVTVQNAAGAHTVNADKTVTFNVNLNATNVKLEVSGAKINGIAIPAFTTDAFGVNVSTAVDSTPPVPGSSGTLTATNVASGGLTLNWTKATDNESAQSALKYYVYQSTSSNIGTVGDCESNGTLLNSGGTADITSYTVTGLSAGTYYFNVIVADEAGNKAAYTAAKFDPVITTTSLPSGTAGTYYSQSLAASGGTPITWSLETGSSLPGGLSLSSYYGTISGTPTQAGTFTFTVKAANGLGSDTKNLSITVTGMVNPTVTTTADSGAGSLRQALIDVSSGGTITVDPSLAGQTITLQSDLPNININCTIEGNGIIISGNNARRIFLVSTNTTVTINRVHFTYGRSTPGGAINNNGSLTLNSCIFSNNTSTGNGGAIENNSNATNLIVRGCTFYNNNASTYGGAIDNCSLPVSIIGCLLWGNTAGSSGAGIYSDYNVTSGGYNAHPSGDSNNFTYITSDSVISAIPFNTSNFTPVSSSGADGVITNRPTNYPTVDFYGNAIPATGATAGAVQGAQPTPVTTSASALDSATGSVTITLGQAITDLAASDVTVKVNSAALTYPTDYTLSVTNGNSVEITFTVNAALNNTSVITVEILKSGYAVNNGSPISVTNSIPAAATPLAQVTGVGLYVTGQAVWDDLADETGLVNYSVQLYKDSSKQGVPKTSSAGTGTIGVNFLTEMRAAGVGTYTVTVKAIGNGTTHSDGSESDPSNPQSVQQLAAPGNLAWSGDNATFDKLAGEMDVASYYITISGGGTVSSNTVAKTGSNLSVPVTSPVNGDTFTVKAIAVTTGLYLDSDGATSAGYAAPTYTATIDPTSKTFTAATVGYGQQAEQTFIIENTGTGQITSLSASLGGSDFEISTTLSAASVNSNGTVTVSVRPKTGLSANAYTDTLTITGSNGISLTASLSFTVSAAQTYTTTITIPQVNGNDPANAVNNPAAAEQGATVNLPTVTAKAGFVFKQWTVTAGGVSITNPTSATGASFMMGTSNVTIHAEFEAATLTFGNQTLANGTYNTTYSANVTAATGGSGTYSYSSSDLSTNLPGLSMTTAGMISGTPTAAAAAQTFTVTVTDTITGATANATYTLTIAMANQTLNASNISRVVGGGNIELSGHATSSANTGEGGTISYAVTTAGAGASISGTTLSYTSTGTASITATAAGDTNYNSATTTFTLTVTLPSLGGTATIRGTNEIGQTLTADTSQITGASGNWHYAWLAGSDAAANTADQNTLVIGGADAGKVITCVITSTDASGSVTAQFDSGRTVPYNIAITNVDNISGDTAVVLSATTGRAGNAISLSYALGNGGGKLTNTLTFTGGTGLTAVTSAGASTNQTYTVTPSDAVNGVITITATFLHTGLQPRTLSFSDAGPVLKVFGDSSFTNTAAPSAGSGMVTYTSSVPSVATVDSNGTVTLVSAGQTTITAEITLDAVYAAATASYTLTITKADQTLTAADISQIIGNGDVDLSGHAISSVSSYGGTITYTVTTAGAGADISGTTLSYTSTGMAVITATAAGDTNYNNATVTFTLTVTLPPLGGTATISGTNEVGQTLTVATSSITGASGNWHYAWFAGTEAAANAADQNTIVIGGADAGKVITCVITSTDTDGSITAIFDSGYTVPYNMAIINVGNISGDTPVTLSASTGRVGNAITLSYVLGNGSGKPTNILTFTSGTGLTSVMSAGAGTGQTYTITPGDAVNGVITITATFLHTDLQPRMLSFSDAGPVTKVFNNGSFTNTAAPDAGSGTVIYTSSVPSVATVDSSGTVTILNVGQTTITAGIASNAVYAEATASYTLTVTKANQTAPFGIDKTDETNPGANNGTMTGVTTTMEYRRSTDTVYAPIPGTTITGLSPGTYYVRYAATASYNPGPDTVITIVAYTTPVTETPSSEGKTGIVKNNNYGTTPEALKLWGVVNTDMGENISANKGYNHNVVTGRIIVVPTFILETLQNSSITLAMHTGMGVTFSITGSDIPDHTDTNATVNLTVRQGELTAPEALIRKKTKDTIHSIEIPMESHESFGMTVNVHFSLGVENADNYANLYRYNEQTGAFEYLGSYQINEDGQAMFGITGGADFLLTVTTEKPDEVIVPMNGDTYTIKPGDTLSGTAAKYGMSVAQIMALNPEIKNSSRIRSGQKIRVR